MKKVIKSKSAKPSKPSKETVAALEGARKEIIAGCVLLPSSLADQVWNDSRVAAVSIIEKYKRGDGLFQL